MKPIPFKGVNTVFGVDQPEYMPLPACKVGNPQGEVLTVWEPTPEEREAIAKGGNIGVSVWTFNNPIQPQRIFVAVPVSALDGDSRLQG